MSIPPRLTQLRFSIFFQPWSPPTRFLIRLLNRASSMLTAVVIWGCVQMCGGGVWGISNLPVVFGPPLGGPKPVFWTRRRSKSCFCTKFSIWRSKTRILRSDLPVLDRSQHLLDRLPVQTLLCVPIRSGPFLVFGTACGPNFVYGPAPVEFTTFGPLPTVLDRLPVQTQPLDRI